MKSLFWDFYAFFYDRMCDLSPYQTLVEQVYRTLVDFGFAGVLLDAGCGTGRLCQKILNHKSVRVYGVDYSTPMLKQAIRKCSSKNAFFIQYSLDKPLPFPDSFFDGIVCIHVLYALKNPLFTLKELHRTLKANGKIIAVNPVRKATLRQHANRKLLYQDGTKILKNIPFHIIMALINAVITTKAQKDAQHFFTMEETVKMFSRSGFKNIQVKPTYDNTSLLVTANK